MEKYILAGYWFVLARFWPVFHEISTNFQIFVLARFWPVFLAGFGSFWLVLARFWLVIGLFWLVCGWFSLNLINFL